MSKAKAAKMSNPAKSLYNTLLDINWDNEQITLGHIQSATKLGRSKLAPMMVELIGASMVLIGPEEGPQGLVEAYTPIVKRSAYGFPYDDFKRDEWDGFKLPLNSD